MTTPILAWHFVRDTLREGRPVPADGVVLRHEGEVIPCRLGLHASIRLSDALQYATGNTLCRVECGGTIVDDGDKIAASERVILWRIDAADILRQFARRCALSVSHLWDMPPIVRKYLETGDEAIRSAAHDVARVAGDRSNDPSAAYAAEHAAFDVSAINTVLAASSAAAHAVHAMGRDDAFCRKQDEILTAMVEAEHQRVLSLA